MRGLLVLGVCVAVALGGCGESSDTDNASTASSTSETTTTASTPQPSKQSTQVEPQAGDKSKQTMSPTPSKGEGSKKQGGDSKESAPKRVKVPPISSAPVAGSRAPAPGVKTVKGADNSVQEYGVESGESERREAAIALQAYLNARAEEDWGSACALLAKKPMEQLERMQRAAAKQGTKLNGCPGTMALLKEGEGQLSQQARITEVLSFRGGGDISGDPSYLIYLAPPSRTLYSMPMYLEGGAWKVGLARAAELPLG